VGVLVQVAVVEAGVIYLASVSGGKDSTAMSLHLRERGIEHRRVFFDTGWEHAATYEYLDYLGDVLGPIERVACTLPIRHRVEWSKTARGGRQMLMDLPDQSGCSVWGLCDLPEEP
jgi:3'-phosphoadenosine 5'-phosphosulfate sulfotransferase (PAPS reductase)/FAD synthetase